VEWVAAQGRIGQIIAQMNAPDTSEQRRKRLLWRATHRGIKEMDLLLGGFVRARIASMPAVDLDALEAIIEVPDQQLLSWATRQESVPPGEASPLLLEILSYRP
jgi:antitoxin CptB